jgi:hypothetical protein
MIAANDFAEAMEPKQTYYMIIDEVFYEWYSTQFPEKPVSTKMLIVVFLIFKDTQKHLDDGINAYTLYLKKIGSNLQHMHHVLTMALFQ